MVTALEKTSTEEDKQGDDNAQTIRPVRSPLGLSIPLAKAPSPDISPIVEDYSDLGGEEDDERIQAKVANFKVSCEAARSIARLIRRLDEKHFPSRPFPSR